MGGRTREESEIGAVAPLAGCVVASCFEEESHRRAVPAVVLRAVETSVGYITGSTTQFANVAAQNRANDRPGDRMPQHMGLHLQSLQIKAI